MISTDSSGDENSQSFNANIKAMKEKGSSSTHYKVICKRRKIEGCSKKKSPEKRWSVAESEVEAEMLEDMGVGKLSEVAHWCSETSNSSDDEPIGISKTQSSINSSAIFVHPGEKSKSANTTVEGEKLTTPVNSQESPFVCTKEEIDFILFRNKSRTEKPKENQFTRLSDEVILLIFSLMPKSMLIQVALVCKRWQRISYDESLWTRLDLSSRRLNAGAMGYVISRGTSTLRLAQTEFTDPIFLDESSIDDEIFKLQYLDLSMAMISATGLGSLLRSCRYLKKLSLEHCTLGDIACAAIARNRSLTVLNMAGCSDVSDIGIRSIAFGCRNITEWNLAWTNLTGSAIESLVANLPDSLEKLNISGQRKSVTDDSIATLVDNCPNLTDLDLSDCTLLREPAVMHLLKLKKLENLAISRCYSITGNTLRHLDNMSSLKALEVFSLMNEVNLELLQKAMTKISINKNIHSQIARPTVGIRRTSIWGIRVRE